MGPDLAVYVSWDGLSAQAKPITYPIPIMLRQLSINTSAVFVAVADPMEVVMEPASERCRACGSLGRRRWRNKPE